MKKLWLRIKSFFKNRNERKKHWTVFNLFKMGPDYKALYEEQVKMTQKWEFRYNKMYRQLMLICREAEERVDGNEDTKV